MDPWLQINHYLRPYNLRSEDRGGSPDCFFHCVSAFLADLSPPRAVSVADLRQQCAAELEQRFRGGPPNFDHVLDEVRRVQPTFVIATWAQYIDRLRRDLFAADLEMGAVVNLFGISIEVFSIGAQGNLVRQEHGQVEAGRPSMKLAFVPNHYHLVLNAPVSLPHPPFSSVEAWDDS